MTRTDQYILWRRVNVLAPRYIDNRFYEIDPARYNIATLFHILQGGF